MAEIHQQWITIDECVNAYLDRSEQGVHKFFKCWHLAFSGLEQMGLDFFYQIKSVRLPVNGNQTVNMPADCINYTKVGVLNNRGEVIPLVYNQKLTTYADLFPDRQQKTTDNTLYDWFFFNSPVFYNYWSGDVVTNLYGIESGAPFVGSFKVDPSQGLILLEQHFFYPYIILEYIASPQEGETYYLPVQFKEALIWYIAWQEIAMMPNTRKGMLGDKDQRRRNYFNERRLGNARFKPLYLEDAYNWNLSNTRMTIKS